MIKDEKNIEQLEVKSKANLDKIKKEVAGEKEGGLFKTVLEIKRVSRMVKGGRRLGFSAFAVVGDKKGKVGFATGKSKDAKDAMKKAIRKAETKMVNIKIWNETIPHSVEAKFESAKVILRPASKGTGIIAGGGIRAVSDMAGIANIKGKSLGSSNKISVVNATIKALQKLRTKEEIKEMLKS
ncbi:MAG: 30S ribosomal protein S5 [Patescibacteria group bacterium]